MRKSLIASLFVIGAAAGCSSDVTVTPGPGPGPAVLTIENQSDVAIVDLFVTDTGSTTWGPDLLGGDVLLSGESIDVTAPACSTYDVMVVDEHNTDCVLESVDLCFDDAIWTIRNSTIASCSFAKPSESI
jgi:hypothetical protein